MGYFSRSRTNIIMVIVHFERDLQTLYCISKHSTANIVRQEDNVKVLDGSMAVDKSIECKIWKRSARQNIKARLKRVV